MQEAMNWHLHLDARNFYYPRGWQLQKNLDEIDHARDEILSVRTIQINLFFIVDFRF